jgi:hypothetical protein
MMKKFKIIFTISTIIFFSLIFQNCYTVFGEMAKEEDDIDWDRSYSQTYKTNTRAYSDERSVIAEEYDTVYVDTDETGEYSEYESPFVQNINIYNSPGGWNPFYYDDDFDWHFSVYLGVYSGYFFDPFWDWYWYRPGRLIVWDPFWWDYYYFYSPYYWAYGRYYWYNYPIFYSADRYVNIGRRSWNKRRAIHDRDEEDSQPIRNRRFVNDNPTPVRDGRHALGPGSSVDVKKDPAARDRTIRTLDPVVREGKTKGKRTIRDDKGRKRTIRKTGRRTSRTIIKHTPTKGKSRKVIRRKRSSVRENSNIRQTPRPKPVYKPRSSGTKRIKARSISRPRPSKPAIRSSAPVPRPKVRSVRSSGSSGKSSSSRKRSGSSSRRSRIR